MQVLSVEKIEDTDNQWVKLLDFIIKIDIDERKKFMI